MPTTWISDIQRRRGALIALAKVSGTVPDADGFFWNEGRYVVLHFDLLTISKTGQSVNRGAAYTAIEKTATGHGGIELGGSVYAVPLSSGEDAVARVVKLWNAVAVATNGQLIEGDAFFLHYSGTIVDQLKCVAQVLPVGKSSLATLNMPTAKQGP